MSVERAVDELYGDTWSDEEKAEEVARLKEEQGMTSMDEPQTGEKDDPPESEEEDPPGGEE